MNRSNFLCSCTEQDCALMYIFENHKQVCVQCFGRVINSNDWNYDMWYEERTEV